MSSVLTELMDLLKLERIEEGIFRGQSQDLGFGNVFGGQVIGQALSAAKQTVNEDRGLHSFHCYFLRPGNARQPIVYEVDNARDGKSFTTRRVVAIQNGKSIFNLAASFQIDEEGFAHQKPVMPEVDGPDGLTSELELVRRFEQFIPKSIRDKMTCDKPIDIRPVNPNNPLQPEKRDPVRYIWLKAAGKLPDDLRVHKYLLAYASDFNFLPTSLEPHGVSFWKKNMQVASLDHSMWFHRDFRMDDWLLYAMESPSASGGRCFVRGQLFDRQGRLVASSTHEGLIRKWA